MVKTILLITLAVVNARAYGESKIQNNFDIEVSAKPIAITLNKSDAEKWLMDFSSAREKTADALFLTNFEKRQNHTRVLMSLREQAEKLFGDVVSQYGDCTKAVESVNVFWKTEISLVTDPANNQVIKAGSLAAWAWDGGMYFYSCRRMIETLK